MKNANHKWLYRIINCELFYQFSTLECVKNIYIRFVSISKLLNNAVSSMHIKIILKSVSTEVYNSSVESQKGVNAVENQKGAMAVQSLWR